MQKHGQLKIIQRGFLNSMDTILPFMALVFCLFYITNKPLFKTSFIQEHLLLKEILESKKLNTTSIAYYQTTFDNDSRSNSNVVVKTVSNNFGTVTIPAGQTCTNVAIPIIEDIAPEPIENFVVVINN